MMPDNQVADMDVSGILFPDGNNASMNKKLVIQFLLLTLTIMLLTDGSLAIFAQFGVTINLFLRIVLELAGALSPAIASYITLKKNKEVIGFKEWIQNVFKFKAPLHFYLLVIFLFLIAFSKRIFIAPGLNDIKQIFKFIYLLPGMLIFGGLEEAGWRYVLQPELDKKYGFIKSSLMVTPIWAIWHLPVFFMPGEDNYGGGFLTYILFILGLTFALGAIIKITKNVFLCVLLHTMNNAMYSTFGIKSTLLENSITAALLIFISIIAVFIYEKRKAHDEGTIIPDTQIEKERKTIKNKLLFYTMLCSLIFGIWCFSYWIAESNLGETFSFAIYLIITIGIGIILNCIAWKTDIRKIKLITGIVYVLGIITVIPAILCFICFWTHRESE